MSRINPDNLKFDEGRLAQVLVAPIVSEKATSRSPRSTTRSCSRSCAMPPSPRSRRQSN
jgi:hypothetical protein